MRILMLMTLSLVGFVSSGLAATPIPVGPLRSIELNDGGRVVVRHGPVQRVSMVKGDPQFTRVRLGDGQRLIIESSGGRRPRGYRLEIEVVTPHLWSVFVSNGGTVQTLGAFPPVASLKIAVEQGGTIDVRSIVADRVDASVEQGGRILTTVQKTLAAGVESGGIITYWGDVNDVRQSVHHGGVVTRGAAGDAERPLSELGPDLTPIPALPRTH